MSVKVSYLLSKNKKVVDIELEDGALASDLIEKLHLTAPNEACAISINGTMKDLVSPLANSDMVEIFSFDEDMGKEVFWHTSAHVLAQAVLRLFPNAKPTIGPPIENGFYYDFADLHITEDDLEKIETEMLKIVGENYKSQRQVFSSKEEALQKFSNNPFKIDLIQSFGPQDEISGYTQGEFFDLCRGPHLPNLGKIKALKIMKTSGAYWKGDSKNVMLTRIYGITFPDKKMLREYLHKLEEAKKRDHKILGPRLDLFSLKEEAPGMPFIHPKGMIVWNRLLDYWRECHKRAGYTEIKTPTMMIKELWERSGHWQNYRENMFLSEVEDREFAIKPMNCPGGMLYYKTSSHSYRELPMRVGEIGLVHRFEPSGSLSGLFRVRCFHQDDAHIFMQPEDIQKEILGVLSLVEEMYSTFGLTYEIELSTRPEKNTIGTDEDWKIATEGLVSALVAFGKPYHIHEGDGAFYGPKIDLKVHDALGRKWQCGTIQLDMALPERFDLEYTSSDGTRKRPVMIHRVIYGSIERFLGSLIEFYSGKFPLWLSPSQISLIPVADRHVPYARVLEKAFKEHNYEVFVDDSNESVSKKVRLAQISHYNYILTIGDIEVEHKSMNVRTFDNVVHGEMTLDALLKELNLERSEKALVSRLSANKPKA